MIATDEQLLKAFAGRRSEAAFRALAERHLGLIFHTALRRTGRRPGALAGNPAALSGWLHRATLFECTIAMRKEASQQRRKQLQHPDDLPSTVVEEDEAAHWQHAIPHLDRALDTLPDSDRQVLPLHFYERQPFSRIATQLGRTTAAVQKQSVRALAKLSKALRAKGVATHSLLLTTGLATESAKAAPQHLLPQITTRALAGAGGLSNATRVAMAFSSHAKMVISCSLLTLALPLAAQSRKINAYRKELAALQTGPTSTPSAVNQKRHAASQGSSTSTISDSLDLVKLMEEATAADGSMRLQFDLDNKLATISAASLAELIHKAVSLEANENSRFSLVNALARTLAGKDPELALTTLTDCGRISSCPGFFDEWMDRDTAAAKVWLTRTQERPEFASLINRQRPEGAELEDYRLLLQEYGSNPLIPLQTSLFRKLLPGDGGQAQAYLESFPPDTWQTELLLRTLDGNFTRSLKPEEVAHLVAMIQTQTHPISQGRLLGILAAGIVATSDPQTPANVDPLLNLEDLTHEQKRTIIQAAACRFLSCGNPATAAMRESMVREWLQEVAPEQCLEIAAGAKAEAMDPLVRITRESLIRLRKQSVPDDESLLKMITQGLHGAFREDAIFMARRIQNPDTKAEVMTYLHYIPSETP